MARTEAFVLVGGKPNVERLNKMVERHQITMDELTFGGIGPSENALLSVGIKPAEPL
jgi:hypothetical protein